MRCSACPGVHRCLEPDGPRNARVLFVGEAPGKDEEKRGQVFVGKTGEEVNRQYLPLAGLQRGQVCIANSISCLPNTSGHKLDPNKAAHLELLRTCAEERLYPLIENGSFELIVPMGRFACEAICPGIDLELHHGIPTMTPWGIPAYPMYHPALGIHEPKRMLQIRTDWHRLRDVLRGRYQRVVDPYPEPDYREVTSVAEIEELDPTLPLGADTESERTKKPFCLTYSQRAGTGRLIRAGRVDLLQALGRRFRQWEAPILVHNLLYDEPIFRDLGLAMPFRRFVDTMSAVYHLGNLPQGLKALAFRECGMVMQDFEDVVKPHSRLLVLDFYEKLSEKTWPRPEESLRIDPETGLWKLYRPQSMSTKLKRFWTDFRKSQGKKDVFKMWEENWTDHWTELEEGIGESYPGMCISHVPFEQALHYACRDADATLRVWTEVILPMRRRVRRANQELWRGAA